MAVIQLEVNEALIQAVGRRAVEELIGKQLGVLEIRHLGSQIAEEIDRSGFDHSEEVEGARAEAWEEYRQSHLKTHAKASG